MLLEVGQRALALAGSLGDAALQVVTRPFLGRIYFGLGDYPQAIDLLRQNVVALGTGRGAPPPERFGLSRLPSVMSRDILARCLAKGGTLGERAGPRRSRARDCQSSSITPPA